MLYDDEISMHGTNCSFCGKRQDQVKKLITSTIKGVDAYICDECTFLCANIMHPDVISRDEELQLRMFNEQVQKAYRDYLIIIRLVTGKKTWNDDSIFDKEDEE